MTVKFNESSLGERILLRPLIEKVSKGGIHIARDSRSQAINTNQGIVEMIGPMAWHYLPEKPDVKVGDKVYYAKYGAMVIQVDGDEDFYIICMSEDILASYNSESKLEQSE